MSHIEKDDCPVIEAKDFARQKAEKQIIKDAWESQLDSVGGIFETSESLRSTTATNPGNITLLDDDHVHQGSDWQGYAHSRILQPENNNGYRAPKPPIEGMGRLALKKFPALPAQTQILAAKNQDRTPQSPPEDLLDLSQAESRTNPDASRRWVGNDNVARMLFPAKASTHVPLSASGLGPAEDMSSFTSTTADPGSKSRPNMWSVLSQPSSNRPLSNDPNAANVSVITTARVIPKSVLDPEQYFNEFTELYECPGLKCQGKFQTTEEFSDHLLGGAHVGGKTQCPSCLNKFRTTGALVAHCESGSRRCQIRKSANYNQVLRELTAGLLGTDGFLSDGSVRYTANPVREW